MLKARSRSTWSSTRTKSPTATKAVLDQLEKLKTQPIDPERIKAAQTQIRTNHIKSMQTAEEVASDLATSYMFTGDIHFNDRYVENIGQVTGRAIAGDGEEISRSAEAHHQFAVAGGISSAPPACPRRKICFAPPRRRHENRDRPRRVSRSSARVELENGTVLIHKHIATTPLVTISMYSLGGLTAEDAKTNGLGNLTMQMLPRGTKRTGAQQIAEFFDSIGGDLEHRLRQQLLVLAGELPEGRFRQDDGGLCRRRSTIRRFRIRRLKPMKERIAAEIDSEDADWEQQALRFFKKKYYGPQRFSVSVFACMGRKKMSRSSRRDDVQTVVQQKILGQSPGAGDLR